MIVRDRFADSVLFMTMAIAVSAAALSAALILPRIARAAPPVQLVQTVPLETDLAVPGIAHAAETWIEMVRGAKSTIDLGQFYLSNAPGTELEQVVQELQKAGERGVRIRVIVSNKMIQNDPVTYERFKNFKNVSVRQYDLGHLTGGIIHAKYWVVDGEEIFVGSQNFDWRALSHIHEMGVRVKDKEIARQLGEIFEIDWKICETGQAPTPTEPQPAPSAPKAIELTASPARFNPSDVRPTLPVLLDLLNGAKKSIRVQVLDHSPIGSKGYWPDLDLALRSAAARGVKVQFLVSHWNTAKPEIHHLKSLAVIPNIEVRIVTIPEHSSGHIPYARVAHSKYAVVDGEALMVSTSNWSQGYFSASRNIEVFLRSAELATQGAAVFEKVWAAPYTAPVDLNRDYPPPRKE